METSIGSVTSRVAAWDEWEGRERVLNIAGSLESSDTLVI